MTERWDTQTEWEAYQNANNIEIANGDVTLHTVFPEHAYSGGVSNDSIHRIANDGGGDWVSTTPTDRVNDVAIDAAGCVHAATDSGGYLMLNPDGSTAPNDGIGGSAWSIATDDEQNAYVGEGYGDVYKYDINSNQVWSVSPASDRVGAIVVDQNKNVYFGSNDYQIYKLDSSGNEDWSEFLDRGVISVDVDINGNVYAGTGNGSIYKYDSTGTELWTQSVSSPPNGISVDPSDSIHFITYSGDVVQKDQNWNTNWTYSQLPTGGYGLAVDFDGYVYAASRGGEIHKIDPSGGKVWEYTDSEVFYNMDAAGDSIGAFPEAYGL